MSSEARGAKGAGPAGVWRGVFFDLDGTLADTVELILRSYRHTMQTHLGTPPPDERWRSTIGTPLRTQLLDFARDELEAAAMLETYTVFQRSVHDEMVRPFPGSLAVLAGLKERGARLAVVTSKRNEVARRTMEVCGLWDAVELVVGADDVTLGKPDPEPVQRALDALELRARPHEVLFVGDSPFDLRAGRAAGTCTAAVGWGAFQRRILEAERPDYFLDTLEEVLTTAPLPAG
ncbi:MAG TPA: HAD-IA family hydrolase [Longimicrobiales bacterium]|nr:HAD-IA family hydrolase [Longimicrobiales bacterium]